MLEFDKTNDCFNIYSYCKLVIIFIGYNILIDIFIQFEYILYYIEYIIHLELITFIRSF